MSKQQKCPSCGLRGVDLRFPCPACHHKVDYHIAFSAVKDHATEGVGKRPLCHSATNIIGHIRLNSKNDSAVTCVKCREAMNRLGLFQILTY